VQTTVIGGQAVTGCEWLLLVRDTWTGYRWSIFVAPGVSTGSLTLILLPLATWRWSIWKEVAVLAGAYGSLRPHSRLHGFWKVIEIATAVLKRVLLLSSREVSYLYSYLLSMTNIRTCVRYDEDFMNSHSILATEVRPPHPPNTRICDSGVTHVRTLPSWTCRYSKDRRPELASSGLFACVTDRSLWVGRCSSGLWRHIDS
jgi:hypothetical protein